MRVVLCSTFFFVEDTLFYRVFPCYLGFCLSERLSVHIRSDNRDCAVLEFKIKKKTKVLLTIYVPIILCWDLYLRIIVFANIDYDNL